MRPTAPEVSEGDEVLAQEAEAQRRAVRLRQLPESSAGIQYWRIRLPIGVPGPTRHISSLSCWSASQILLSPPPVSAAPAAETGLGAAYHTTVVAMSTSGIVSRESNGPPLPERSVPGHALSLSAGLRTSGRSRNTKAIENRIPSADKTDGSPQRSIP